MSAFYSYDGSPWYYIDTYKGNEGYWRTVIGQSIAPGDVNLYLKFDFDAGVADNSGEGVFLDNIAITGDLITYPNLVPYQVNGMDDIIVTSSETGTLTNTPVYANELFHVDLGVKNIGQATSFITPILLLVDDILVFSYGYDPDLLPGDDKIFTDIPVVLDEGWHTFRMVLDSLNAVPEGNNENDNVYEKDIYVAPRTITFTGHLYYQDPIPPDTFPVPMKNIRIEMWDDDDVTFDDSLTYAITDDSGYFTLGPFDNSNDEYGTLDIYFKIYAENDACYVWDSYNADETYKIVTEPKDNLASSQYDTTIIATFEQSGYFFTAENVLKSYDKWNEITGLTPNYVRVIVPMDNITGYSPSSPSTPSTIIISRLDYYQKMFPDNFDASMIAEEYGHHLAYSYDFCDSCDESGISTLWNRLNTPSWSTMCESWTLFWSSVVRDTNMHYNWALDKDSLFTYYGFFDLENGGHGTWTPFAESFASVNNYGDSCIGSVSGILWDIYDQRDDDYSTYGYFPQDHPFNSSDNIGDTLDNGIDNILSTLLDRNVNGHRPDNITEFWDAWFQVPSFGHSQAMSDIWYEHGIITSCCIGIRGNIDGDSQELIDMSDIVYMSDFMFTGGPPPPCNEEANVDGDALEIVDISDFVYLIDFAFSNPAGPPPPSCP